MANCNTSFLVQALNWIDVTHFLTFECITQSFFVLFLKCFGRSLNILSVSTHKYAFHEILLVLGAGAVMCCPAMVL